MKIKTLLVVAVMILGCSAAAFAQATFTVGSIPQTAVANSGQTEKTGDVTFNTISGSPDTVTGTMTISYGIPITVGRGSIKINGVLDPVGTTFTINTVNNQAGQLVLNVLGGVPAPITATISGVRVATAGTTLTSLTANISSTGNAITAGQTGVIVINSITAGISAVSMTTVPGSGKINAVTGAVAATPVNLRVREGFLNAYGVTPATDPTQTISTMVRITLSALPPAGVTLTFPQFASTKDTNVPAVVTVTNAFELADSAGVFATGDLAITSASPSTAIYYRVVTDTNVQIVEDLFVPVGITVATTATLPLPSSLITFTATLAPIGTAFNPNPPPLVLAKEIPRYAASEVGPATLLNISSGATSLLIPFASRVTASGFDTGFAIANTTTDPGTTAMGFDGAVKQNGTMTFYFYPQVGAPFTYTTAGTSPGTGLGATSPGVLDTGDSYTVLLSQLLTAAAAPADFTGYVVVICNFTNAHGQYVVSDFKSFSNGSQPLVLNTGGPVSVTGGGTITSGDGTITVTGGTVTGRGGPEGNNQ